MIKVLFVCLGNICRSPLAEAIFNDMAKKRGLDGKVRAQSAGTSNYHIGEQPDIRTFEVARKFGLELDHLGRQISRGDFDEFDYILAMDDENLENILLFKQRYGKGLKNPQIFKIRKFDDDQSESDVPDPYFGGSKGFDKVYNLLYDSIYNFLDYLEEEHKLK